MNFFLLFVGLLPGLCCFSVSAESLSVEETPLSVFTTIPPQKNMIERVGGKHVIVESLIQPGIELEAFDPGPQQISRLLSADLFFPIGYPEEKKWLQQIKKHNENVVMHACCEQYISKNSKWNDTHIWNDPLNYLSILDDVTRLLIQLKPEHEAVFEQNAAQLRAEVSGLHENIRQCFANKKDRAFVVDHGAWDYFAKRYGLIQLALEYEGKENGPKEIRNIIRRARAEGIKTVFIRRNASSTASQIVIKELGARTEAVDPVAENYPENLRMVAKKILIAMGDEQCQLL